MKRFVWITAAVLLVIGLASALAWVLPQREDVYDFIMLYAATLGIIKHVPLYDGPAITGLTMLAVGANGDFYLPPYPYPPWYALSTFYLGWLPLVQAANAWMILNITMLVTSILLLTEDLKLVYRIGITLAALIYIPALGLIVVGQYSVPVFLGTCLFVYAVRHEDAPFTALGFVLMSFKPHLGFFLIPAGLLWLITLRTPFSKRALWIAGCSFLGLILLGFLADPAWPITYPRSLLSYTSLPQVANSQLLASFPALLTKMLLGHVDAFWVPCLSIAGLVILSLVYRRFEVFSQMEGLIAAGVLMMLLTSSYLLNYDYVFLLLPIIYLARVTKTILTRLLLGLVYVLPWLSLVLGRNANIVYVISALALLFILLRKNLNPHIDDLAEI